MAFPIDQSSRNAFTHLAYAWKVVWLRFCACSAPALLEWPSWSLLIPLQWLLALRLQSCRPWPFESGLWASTTSSSTASCFYILEVCVACLGLPFRCRFVVSHTQYPSRVVSLRYGERRSIAGGASFGRTTRGAGWIQQCHDRGCDQVIQYDTWLAQG